MSFALRPIVEYTNVNKQKTPKPVTLLYTRFTAVTLSFNIFDIGYRTAEVD